MATSGSFDFSLTAAQVIAEAAENLGILAPNGTINSDHQTSLLRTLNIVAKEFSGEIDGSPGLKVHTRQRVTLFLAKGQQTYTVGPASGDSRATTQYGRTTLSAAEAIGQTTISITSNTDTTTYPGSTVTMTSGDIVGIQQNDGTIHWSTISGTPASTMTIADATTVAASSGNYVYWFTSRAQRFVDIESAVLRDSDRNDREVDVYRDVRAYELGVVDKYSDGTPTGILVEPLRTNTRITLNSQPTDVTEQLHLTVLYPAEDYDATSNDIAFPQEWYGFLVWELTLRGCPKFGVTWTQDMQLNYTNARSRAASLNPEKSDMYFQPGCL